MNMASICTIFSVFLVAFISTGHANKEFVKVQCKAENIGQYGQQSLLHCVIETTQEASNAEIRLVIWKKVGDDKPLLLFRNEVEARKGYKFADPSWNEKNMNISLLITNTAVEHEGDYRCDVITDSGESTGFTKLKVTARYNQPTVSSIPKTIYQGVEGTLICNARSGYPKGQLRWFALDTDWTKSAEMQAEQEESGLFNLTSKLILLQGSTFSKYTCVVYNASGGKEDEVTFDVPELEQYRGPSGPDPATPSKIVAPVVVIGSLIIGLLLVLVIRRRSQQARRQSTTPLMGNSEPVPTDDV